MGPSYADGFTLRIEGTVNNGESKENKLNHWAGCSLWDSDYVTGVHYKCNYSNVDEFNEKSIDYSWSAFGKREWVCQYFIDEMIKNP